MIFASSPIPKKRMVRGIKTGTGIYLTKSIYGVSNRLKNFDSDINNAIGKAAIMESRKAIITRDTVAKTSIAKLPVVNEIAEVTTLIGDGKNSGLIKPVCSVMKYHKPNKNNTDTIAGQ